MTLEIKREDWKEFFDNLSRDLVDCLTTIQVLDNETGAQVLNENLPFGGLTFEERNGREVIELIVGDGPENHQTHNIYNPRKVAFVGREGEAGGTLDIEDADDVKTLITFREARFMTIEYREEIEVMGAA
jgi:hypothetical protein